MHQAVSGPGVRPHPRSTDSIVGNSAPVGGADTGAGEVGAHDDCSAC